MATTTVRYTADLSDGFFEDGIAVARWLGAAWADLLGVMFLESGVSASQPNLGGSGAGGLIQFTVATLRALGFTGTMAEFLTLGPRVQLAWVRRYFAPHRGKLDTLAGVYCAVWMPADLDHRHDKSFVLSAKGGRRGWAFEGNAILDVNGDLTITVGELEEAVRRGCQGPRWIEIARRAGVAVGPVSAGIDLGVPLGIQQALVRLGIDPGPLDGIVGERTRAALRVFQGTAGLVPDAIPGPRTRAALAEKLAVLIGSSASGASA